MWFLINRKKDYVPFTYSQEQGEGYLEIFCSDPILLEQLNLKSIKERFCSQDRRMVYCHSSLSGMMSELLEPITRNAENTLKDLKNFETNSLSQGGGPCQDLSIAGKGEGLEGEKSGLWFEMLRIIREIRPRYIFVENSPMLIVRGFDRVSGDLTEVGYDLKWGIVGANDANAPHQRKRFWMWGEL